MADMLRFGLLFVPRFVLILGVFASAGLAQLPALPHGLVAALQHDSCQLPSAPAVFSLDSVAIVSHVAYRANVRQSGVVDWVILCQSNGRREVRVYADKVALGAPPALRVPITWDAAEQSCEGWISIADSNWVRAALVRARFEDGKHPLSQSERRQALHAGIIDGMCEGQSTRLRYWTGRRWVDLGPYWDRDSSVHPVL